MRFDVKWVTRQITGAVPYSPHPPIHRSGVEKKAEDSPKSSGIRKLVPAEKGTQDIVIFREDDMSHMLDTGQHAHHQHYDGIRIEFACSF